MTSATRYRHHFAGCQPEPLGAYLKALGLLRLVGEQADPTARGWWEQDGFGLECSLDDEAFAAFFLDRYEPTPILSPWNNSSGFGPEGKDQLAVIEASSDPRLASYRTAIGVARALKAEPWWAETAGSRDPMKEQKVRACRARLPDACVAWIDAAVVLADERIAYPPLLGTGGNDGRLELSRNFHEAVLDAVGLTRSALRRAGWLADALHGTRSTPLPTGRSPGQFGPGAAGGPNSGPTESAPALRNPWDWVLLIEGSLLFASGVARRMAAAGGQARAASPFTVDASVAGYETAADESSRGELWLPLWERPTALPELRRLFAEARADWEGRHVRNGIEMAKATAALGVDRGIAGFSRQVFLERNGLATIAAPAGRLRVEDEVRPDVALVPELDRWLDRLRRARLPAGVATALRHVDREVFSLVQRQSSPLDVLRAAAVLDAAVSRSSTARERVGPLSLDGDRWAPVLLRHQDQAELRLALSLASGRERGGDGQVVQFRQLVRPSWRRGAAYLPAPVDGLGVRSIVDVLADAHARRVIERVRTARSDGTHERAPGMATRYAYGTAALLVDVAALQADLLDDGLLASCIAACLLLRFRNPIRWPVRSEWSFLPPELCAVGPFYAEQPATAPRTDDASGSEAGEEQRAPVTDHPAPWDDDIPWSQQLTRTPLLPDAEWPSLLAANRLTNVMTAATRRLQIAGLRPILARRGLRPSAWPSQAGRRLGATLLFRLDAGSRRALLTQYCPEPVSDRPPSANDQGVAP